MVAELSAEEKNPEEQPNLQVIDYFISSPWYTDIIYVCIICRLLKIWIKQGLGSSNRRLQSFVF